MLQTHGCRLSLQYRSSYGLFVFIRLQYAMTMKSFSRLAPSLENLVYAARKSKSSAPAAHIRTLSLDTYTYSNNIPLLKGLALVSLLSEFGLALTRVLFTSTYYGRQF